MCVCVCVSLWVSINSERVLMNPLAFDVNILA